MVQYTNKLILKAPGYEIMTICMLGMVKTLRLINIYTCIFIYVCVL